jgi:hypothetical protein
LGATGAGAAQNGSVSGSVSDPSGGRIAAANVSLRDGAGVTAYRTRTSDDGSFSLEEVASGRYTVSVEAPGFSQSEIVQVAVTAGAVEKVTVQLELAAVSDYLVISATRNSRPLSEVPSSTSLISNDDLRLQNQLLLSESLRATPGLVVTQTGGRGGLTSIFTRGGESDYNKMLIDGVPVNGSGGQFDFSQLSTENLDRIEVVRGPGSALFGSDAMTRPVSEQRFPEPVAVGQLRVSGDSCTAVSDYVALERFNARSTGAHGPAVRGPGPAPETSRHFGWSRLRVAHSSAVVSDGQVYLLRVQHQQLRSGRPGSESA